MLRGADQGMSGGHSRQISNQSTPVTFRPQQAWPHHHAVMSFASFLSGGLLPILFMLSPFAVMASWPEPVGTIAENMQTPLKTADTRPMMM